MQRPMLVQDTTKKDSSAWASTRCHPPSLPVLSLSPMAEQGWLPQVAAIPFSSPSLSPSLSLHSTAVGIEGPTLVAVGNEDREGDEAEHRLSHSCHPPPRLPPSPLSSPSLSPSLSLLSMTIGIKGLAIVVVGGEDGEGDEVEYHSHPCPDHRTILTSLHPSCCHPHLCSPSLLPSLSLLSHATSSAHRYHHPLATAATICHLPPSLSPPPSSPFLSISLSPLLSLSLAHSLNQRKKGFHHPSLTTTIPSPLLSLPLHLPLFLSLSLSHSLNKRNKEGVYLLF